jgi:hypothetical protein
MEQAESTCIDYACTRARRKWRGNFLDRSGGDGIPQRGTSSIILELEPGMPIEQGAYQRRLAVGCRQHQGGAALSMTPPSSRLFKTGGSRRAAAIHNTV